MRFGLSQQDIERLQGTLASIPEIETAIVFGSRAKGDAERGSDIDLALQGKDVSEKTVLTLLNALEELPLPYFYDVVVYHDIQNQALIEHINRVGGILYQRS